MLLSCHSMFSVGPVTLCLLLLLSVYCCSPLTQCLLLLSCYPVFTVLLLFSVYCCSPVTQCFQLLLSAASPVTISLLLLSCYPVLNPVSHCLLPLPCQNSCYSVLLSCSWTFIAALLLRVYGHSSLLNVTTLSCCSSSLLLSSMSWLFSTVRINRHFRIFSDTKNWLK
jgi:hypothetical protein